MDNVLFSTWAGAILQFFTLFRAFSRDQRKKIIIYLHILGSLAKNLIRTRMQSQIVTPPYIALTLLPGAWDDDCLMVCRDG